ncbi:hypothetical protein EAG_14252 [Camponotus floridanus]|uniref:Uncharacterized protein n=1 Tax=Camponotus floridanus TaxID=104421 RepID=E2A2R2_CAMFO|nr:hypothetical protein EAG_14252 [Camponotus floridanus]
MRSAGSCRPAEHPPDIGRGAVRPHFLNDFNSFGKRAEYRRVLPTCSDPATGENPRSARTPNPSERATDRTAFCNPFGRGNNAARRRGQLAGTKRTGTFGTLITFFRSAHDNEAAPKSRPLLSKEI